MQTTRRVFLHRLMQFAVAVVGLFSPLHGRAQVQTSWRIRRARATDAADLVAIFNAHRRAGICPYADEIAAWTLDRARAFLEIYNGTLLLERDGLPVGFAGLIDYSNPTTASAILPDAEPELTVVALDFDELARAEVLPAVKRLAAAMGRELQRMGFNRCRLRLLAQPLFESNAWYTRHMTVLRVRQRDGLDHAVEVSIDVSGCVAELAGEGL